jgi:hypothetical protein
LLPSFRLPLPSAPSAAAHASSPLIHSQLAFVSARSPLLFHSAHLLTMKLPFLVRRCETELSIWSAFFLIAFNRLQQPFPHLLLPPPSSFSTPSSSALHSSMDLLQPSLSTRLSLSLFSRYLVARREHQSNNNHHHNYSQAKNGLFYFDTLVWRSFHVGENIDSSVASFVRFMIGSNTRCTLFSINFRPFISGTSFVLQPFLVLDSPFRSGQVVSVRQSQK